MADKNRPRLKSPSRGRAPVTALVKNERAIDGKDSYYVRFDLEKDIKVHFDGPLGPHGPDAETSDLLDIALSVMFVERDLRKLALTNRVSRITITIPVRELSKWASRRATLEEILRFMGGHDWQLEFTKSLLPPRKANNQLREGKKLVVLHSGGMDSACGLGSLLTKRRSVQLVSFYTNQRPIQEQIAAELEFAPPSQLYATWQDKKSRRGRGAFAYRSFLFLSLATLVARSFGARSILQFENGFMAASVPPCANYFVTRHAHPKYHRLFNELLEQMSLSITVENPFRWKTKRQAVLDFRNAVGAGKADRILAKTQSCWFFSYHQFHSRFKRERIEKNPHQHCGLCVPCLVRRTAFRDQDYSLDPRKPPRKIKDKANVSYNYDAYLAFCRWVRDNGQTAIGLRRALLQFGIILDAEAGPWESLRPLLVQFSREFISTFNR
jgi:7-cyano-7-deazaguanine synthase in queuosine biosynthesis